MIKIDKEPKDKPGTKVTVTLEYEAADANDPAFQEVVIKFNAHECKKWDTLLGMLEMAKAEVEFYLQSGRQQQAMMLAHEAQRAHELAAKIATPGGRLHLG